MTLVTTLFIAILVVRLIFMTSRGQGASTSRHRPSDEDDESPKVDTRDGIEFSDMGDRWDD